MALLKKSFFRGLDGAAGPNFSIEPKQHYSLPAGMLEPATITALLASGALMRLSGDPGPGFEVVEITPKWFESEPPPPPTEALIDGNELCERLGGITLADLDLLRGQYGFPAPTSKRTVRTNPDSFAYSSTQLWLWSGVQRWLRENPLRKSQGWGE
ncbi:MAG: hypothetical protein Q8T13_16375 [Acidobacteriota bacterium]|nr:hypothetical protein [Acidobacteriota bacterium]